jgi:hypothetical protein
MGTRNLTMVINESGETKVAQYGQWDGYPSCVGVNVLTFLSNKSLFNKFKSKLSRVRFLDYEGVDKDFIESYEKNAPEWSNDPDNRTYEQKRWFSTYMHRDLAEEVLTNIANSEDETIIIDNSEETAKGSDSCIEWSYVIDLQKEQFIIYNRLDDPPLKTYKLSDLPSEELFLSDLEEE